MHRSSILSLFCDCYCRSWYFSLFYYNWHYFLIHYFAIKCRSECKFADSAVLLCRRISLKLTVMDSKQSRSDSNEPSKHGASMTKGQMIRIINIMPQTDSFSMYSSCSVRLCVFKASSSKACHWTSFLSSRISTLKSAKTTLYLIWCRLDMDVEFPMREKEMSSSGEIVHWQHRSPTVAFDLVSHTLLPLKWIYSLCYLSKLKIYCCLAGPES